MKTSYGIMALMFIVAMSSMVVFAEPVGTNIPNLQAKQYFSDLSLDTLNYITNYSRIPQNRTIADSKKYERVLLNFWGWMKKTLNEEILPPQSLLSTNIVLIPEDDSLEEDIAYFPYSISNKSFLVVQNANTIMLFTDCQASLQSKDVLLKEDILSITTNLLCTNIMRVR